MTWAETRLNNGLVEPLIREELAKRYKQVEEKGETYFRKKNGELLHLVRVRILDGGADFFTIEYMGSMEDGDSFYPEDYDSLEEMMKEIFREIDQE